MRIYVKNLRGTHFEIEVKPEDAVADVKKNIESAQGSDVYPAARQMLIHQGKVLKDGTTLEENNVAEKSCVVIMLTKSKRPSGEGSTASTAATAKAPQSSAPAPVTAQASPISQSPVAQVPAPLNPVTTTHGTLPAGASGPSSTTGSESNIYGQAASSLVAGTNLEGSIQQLLDMGGGTWDRDTVVRALRAAYNNPERAVEYLYSGIPQSTEAPTPTVSRAPSAGQTTPPAAQPPPSGPNANPLDLFPQGVPPGLGSNLAGANNLDFLRNSNQFQALRAMVQANPQILQPMLQELGKQNPHLVRLIQEHQADFLRLLNEPLEGEGRGAGNALRELAEAMPQSIQVTTEEREAIGRLEAMGFDRALVLEVFFACNKNEELAANYLLDHSHEFED